MGQSLPARIVFMGTPAFAERSLSTLIESGSPPVAVFTQPDRPTGRRRVLTSPPVKATALAHDLPVYQPETLRDPLLPRIFEELAPDVIAVAAYGRILPQWLLDLPRLGCVNVHASLLPRHRGAAPIAYAIWEGDEDTGVCTMRMEAGLDTGPVYLCERISIPADATAGSLTPILADRGAHLLVKTLHAMEHEGLRPTPQDDAAATLAPRLKREMGRLDFFQRAERLERQIRAFHPWPGCFFPMRGETVKVLSAVSGPPAPGGVPPGYVLDGPPVTVVCGRGTTLQFTTLQRPGKTAMAASEVIRGFTIEPGSRLQGDSPAG